MTRRLILPDAPAAADADAGGILHAPSAARNADAILEVLLPALPPSGTLLELASGTGQHAAALAERRPDLRIRPSDPDPVRRRAIDARCRALPNVAAAADIDVGARGWAGATRAEAILVVNLLHLLSEAETAVLLDEAAGMLAPGGLLAIYGPFLRDGRATSDGDRAFDASLRAQDPAIGYKGVEAARTWLTVLGLTVAVVEMPANNLMLLARRDRTGGL